MSNYINAFFIRNNFEIWEKAPTYKVNTITETLNFTYLKTA